MSAEEFDPTAYSKGLSRLPKVLEQMGYKELRKGQAAPITHIMSCKDTLCILPTGGGKCHGTDTEILMYNGNIKKVQDVRVGDLVMGPDSKPRRVLGTTKGHDTIYEIQPANGEPFTCNKDHILTLLITGTEAVKSPTGTTLHRGDIFDISVSDYLRGSKSFKKAAKVFTVGVNFPDRDDTPDDAYLAGLGLVDNVVVNGRIADKYKLGSRRVREHFLAGVIMTSYTDKLKTGYKLSVEAPAMAKDIAFIARSIGYGTKVTSKFVYIYGDTYELTMLSKLTEVDIYPAVTPLGMIRHSGFKVVEKGPDAYYGFQLDGDGRYLLGSFMVTHNSALYAVPTLAMGWKTIVFSPLIALMADQVQSMNAKGIRAACINSAQPDIENYTALREWGEGKLDMLYVAPERIKNEQFRMAVKATPPHFVACDESHVMSQWAATFRPAYCEVGGFIDEFNPKVVAGFTATATDQVIEDVKRIMRMENCIIDRYYPRRENLHLSSEFLENESDVFPAVLEKVRTVTGSCLVYCPTVKEVEAMTLFLSKQGESVTWYHGQIARAEDKAINQDQFMSGRARICVATNAFGMGVDKPDIEAVIHTGPPGSIEAIAQETGRAARDGRDAICHMFCTRKGMFLQQFFWENSNPTSQAVRKAYGILMQHADSEGVARITGKELSDMTGEAGIECACNALESNGCVERFKEEGQVYTFYLQDKPLDDLKPAQRKIYDIILENGTPCGENAEGEPTYKIDLNYLAGKCSVLPNTMKTKITDLAKTKVVIVKNPFRGKCTRLLRPPTDEDLYNIDTRRAMEWQKIQDVRDYLQATDKQAYLEEYFALSTS